MIPIVMLGINTGALSPFLTLFCLTVTCLNLKHVPVIYLIMVAARAIQLIPQVARKYNVIFPLLSSHNWPT
jgi:hypothetical protein